MNESRFHSQVELLLDVLPSIAAETCFAMHGGSAINLFVREMPRLSVDIDLTYLTIEDRERTLANISAALNSVKERLAIRQPQIRVAIGADSVKLLCSHNGAQIKVEVNTVMRGSLGEPIMMLLSRQTQERFDRYVEMRIVPLGQLYGGKICAALDRQHPRDLFDIKYMLQGQGVTAEIARGFLLCLLSGDRPLHELLQPSLLDQRSLLISHFAGMSTEPFTYEDFEQVRQDLLSTIHTELNAAARELLISFAEGDPAWAEHGFADFEVFPAVQWKLQNVRRLRIANPAKHRQQLDALRSALGQPAG